ncbi:MAG: hypothetical protein OEZ54_09165 [Gemmatimonadota bacterium]|nr:hypothetical protein [Gemmatimonadota bacterium]
MRGRIALLAAALFVFANAAEAQNEFQRQVRSQIEGATGFLESAGYGMSADPTTGSLNQGSSETFTVRLVGGMEYALVGVCDNDCSDIDLEVFGPNGNSLDSDFEVDDFPVLEFTAPSNGSYTVEVSMPGCSVEPCYYGVGTFMRSN